MMDLTTAKSALPQEDWSRHYQLCALYMKVAQLATWQAADSQRYEALQAAFSELETAAAQPDSSPGDDQATNPWVALSRFSRKLQEFYDGLAVQIAEAAGRQDQIGALIQAKRALLMLDARDAWRLRGMRMSVLLGPLDAYNTLIWQQQRLEAARADADDRESQYLSEAAEAYHSQAVRLLRPAAVASSAGPQLSVDVPCRFLWSNDPLRMCLSTSRIAARPRPKRG